MVALNNSITLAIVMKIASKILNFQTIVISFSQKCDKLVLNETKISTI